MKTYPATTVGQHKLVHFVNEFLLFGIRQAEACVFGGFLLGVMLITSYWQPFGSLHRYDLIFILAVSFQCVLLIAGLESRREALVIIVFHILATLMELFKTSAAIGSWQYPEPFAIGIANVPLFSGFLYSAVGSYIARAWRIFEFRFSSYPSVPATIALVAAIYVNFFTHHFLPDIRWLLFGLTAVMFGRTWIHFRIVSRYRRMPLIVGWFLVALFIWLAENIGSFAGVWLYPNQLDGWQLVSLGKLSSWYLLMLLSFVLVSLVNERGRLAK